MMNKCDYFNKLMIALFFIFMASGVAHADGTGWHFEPGKMDNNRQFHARMPGTFNDDITPDQKVSEIQLTPAQKHQAAVWGLSHEEEKRYVALMKNRSGYFYGEQEGHITPVQVLGFNARSDEERQKYAELDAKQQFQYLAKYLAYLSSYNQAAQALKERLNVPVVREFDYSKYSPYSYQPVALKPHDKLMLFVNKSSAVKTVVSSLMASIVHDPSIQLNVYFTGKSISQSDIAAWAKGQNIPPSMVANKQITLNYDTTQFAALKTTKPLPILVVIRGGETQFINTGKF